MRISKEGNDEMMPTQSMQQNTVSLYLYCSGLSHRRTYLKKRVYPMDVLTLIQYQKSSLRGNIDLSRTYKLWTWLKNITIHPRAIRIYNLPWPAMHQGKCMEPWLCQIDSIGQQHFENLRTLEQTNLTFIIAPRKL